MNKDNYKKALDQIHASESLKEKTFEKINNHKKIDFVKILSMAAVVVLVFSVSLFEFKNLNQDENEEIKIANSEMLAQNDLPRFESMKQLRKVLSENQKIARGYNGEIQKEDIATFDAASTKSSSVTTDTAVSENLSSLDYSKTNTQVENVDEADIVKTDGTYIYYITNNVVYIIKADTLDLITFLKYDDNQTARFSPYQLYINENKMIVLGNYYEYTENISRAEDSIAYDYVSIRNKNIAKAIVYDITDRNNPEIIREVGLDGNYINSRMVGDNIYFISRKYFSFYSDELKDEEILPVTYDSSKSNEYSSISYKDIAYFSGTQNYDYMLVCGFNINDKEEAKVESFFGASDDVYASEKSLYITQISYGENYIYNGCKTIIYKFDLDSSNIKLVAKGEVEGYINNQFSMDEYDGFLRIATTIENYDEPISEIEDETTVTVNIGERKTKNALFILNEDLKEVGKIDDLAPDEQIYSVRFMGKIGYIVTFKEIDPLFVIDLSNPENPVIKGELKIPGYSSYLHPYDENHIIGIGHNTKKTSSGGITNTNMKISMFDVSDLENPKEIFSEDIGGSYAYSELEHNHKVLFYSKAKNLIGFPVSLRELQYRDDKNGFIIFKIDLENGKFEKYGEILQKIDYRTNIDRAIYIEDKLYTLSDSQIVCYDLNTLQMIKELKVEN